MPILLRYVVLPVVVGVWMWCVLDVVRTPAERVQNLHKLVWLVFVLVFVPVGPLAWLLLGRPVPVGQNRRNVPGHPASPSRAPDDSPEFLARLDAEIKRRRRAEEIRKGEIDPAEVDDEIRRLEDEFGTDEDDGEPPASV